MIRNPLREKQSRVYKKVKRMYKKLKKHMRLQYKKPAYACNLIRRAEDKLNTDTLASRRDITSLQGMTTTITAVREAGENVTIRAVLPRLIDTVFTFNLAFLTVTEAAAAPQRCLLLTRKHQNKPLIISQE
ncbi:uncharacterized protein BDCG_17093 [Blastomyces dermatitidis ER-3]|uniref:Uncharacterized protein n=1 Tax=Ajellomyces dermatitidis (strain ER-3 / ATCC MYA-2586) TaxID=559297 RepID=A0ABX2VWB5_AJEDR|nr:uncharacterized protein BDCG_17093 [Blastomyces dermatitidis ER-3]OAT01448.1 hypothetical protein BDCG_17093 [Blastomyces dermatitidis ER-3]